MNTDVLVFAAHPDDAELAMGGTIAKLTSSDYKVGIIDLTRGELGTRGSVDIRQKEAFEAAIVLKTSFRENLYIPDGNIAVNQENLIKVIMTIRKYKPKIVFAPYFNDRHPDHIDTSILIKRAMFYSGLQKIQTFNREVPQHSYRPKKLFYYMQTYTFKPSFIVDISETFDLKMNAIECYATQFHNPKSLEPETFISRPEFLSYIKSRAVSTGFKIGKSYGEAFFCEEEIEMNLESLLEV